jgi:hypothetical protein
MSPDDLIGKLHDQPFRPFRARLSNNSTIDVLDPNSVIVSATSAIMPMEYGQSDRGNTIVLRWKNIALNHIIEFVDLETKDNGSKRRGKK